MLGVMARQRVALRRLTADAGTVFATFGRRDQSTRKLISSGNDVFRATASESRALSATIRALPGFLHRLRTLSPVAGRLSRMLSPSLRELQPVAGQLDNTVQGTERVGLELRATARPLDGVTRRASSGLRALQQVVQVAGPLLDRFSPLAGNLVPAAQFLNAYRTDFTRSWAMTAAATEKTAPSASGRQTHYVRLIIPLSNETLNIAKDRSPFSRSNPYPAPGGLTSKTCRHSAASTCPIRRRWFRRSSAWEARHHARRRARSTPAVDTHRCSPSSCRRHREHTAVSETPVGLLWLDRELPDRVQRVQQSAFVHAWRRQVLGEDPFGHPHQHVGAGQRDLWVDPGRLARDSQFGALQEALMEQVPEGRDLGVVAHRLHERADRAAMAGERPQHRLERGTGASLGGLQPRSGAGRHIALQRLTQTENQVTLVAEVGVERRARDAGTSRDLVDADLSERGSSVSRSVAARMRRCSVWTRLASVVRDRRERLGTRSSVVHRGAR
nr:hypothetical protein [Conexibacter sp. W3-3-2]